MITFFKNLFSGRSQETDTTIRLPPIPEPEMRDALVSVPLQLKPDGMYAITLAQAEMYDLGNIKFIHHYVLMDRKNGTAVDITADIKQAPLLSRVAAGTVLPPETVSNLETWLTGQTKLQYSEDFPQGIKEFRVTEVSAELAASLRTALDSLATTRKAFDAAVTNLRKELAGVRSCYPVPPEQGSHRGPDGMLCSDDE